MAFVFLNRYLDISEVGTVFMGIKLFQTFAL